MVAIIPRQSRLHHQSSANQAMDYSGPDVGDACSPSLPTSPSRSRLRPVCAERGNLTAQDVHYFALENQPWQHFPAGSTFGIGLRFVAGLVTELLIGQTGLDVGRRSQLVLEIVYQLVADFIADVHSPRRVAIPFAVGLIVDSVS